MGCKGEFRTSQLPHEGITTCQVDYSQKCCLRESLAGFSVSLMAMFREAKVRVYDSLLVACRVMRIIQVIQASTV